MLSGNDISMKFRELQLYIVNQLERIDPGFIFKEDPWEREAGGGGVTMTLAGGNIIEKGGVAFSKVEGAITPEMKSQMGMKGNSFLATGVSIVLHSRSPRNPIIHMNVRYFETDEGICWFGGGIDLTPIYIVPSQAAIFHKRLKNLCDSCELVNYEKLKTWADDYFFQPHRNETRGIGGIFFDHLIPQNENQKQVILNFCSSLCTSFPDIYAEQLNPNGMRPNDAEIEWQLLRRSRYVEFNLLHDKGTKFGIVSQGRTESILLSMPPLAKWVYDYKPNINSEEERTLSFLKKGIDWINFL